MKYSKSLLVSRIIVAISLIICASVNLYKLTVADKNLSLFISSYSLIATSLFGAYYLISGSKKDDSATFYKVFMILFALSWAVSIICFNSTLDRFISCLAAVLLMILALIKDMGKKITVAVTSILLAITTIMWITHLGSDALGLKLLTTVCLSFSTIIIVLAKYEDKQRRNTK